MKKIAVILLSCLSMFISCVVLSLAAEPKTYKLAVLLPLTGTFSAVAETQKQGALLAVADINNKGGLSMPWGKVKVEALVADDEAKIDVAIRRLKYMLDRGANAVSGQAYTPVSLAVNEAVKKDPIPYIPFGMLPKEVYQKGKLAPGTFGGGFSSWTVGFMDASAAINVLGKKKIYLLGRSDGWGWDIRDGVYAAAKQYGAEIVGYDEVSAGTSDFTTILQKVKAAKPDVFISTQFAGDAIALLNQCYQAGLHGEMTIFNAWMTNVVAKGIPPKARQGVYAIHFFYYDMAGFPDKDVVRLAKEYTDKFQKEYGYPPDSYATTSYIGIKELLRAVEAAGSFDTPKVIEALLKTSEFMTVKGAARWREDHQPIYKYAGFLVRGKGPDEQKHEWDLFKIEGAQGGEAIYPTLKMLGF